MVNLLDDLKRSDEDLAQIFWRTWINTGKFIDLICCAKFIFYRSICRFSSWKVCVYADLFQQSRVWTIRVILVNAQMYTRVHFIKSVYIRGSYWIKARMISELMVAQGWMCSCIFILKSGLSLIFWLQWFHCSIWCIRQRLFIDK